MLAFVESRQMDGLMSKKKSIFDSGTTKGSAPRKSNKKKYDENWEKIFGKKKNKDTKSK
tara:strand:- start:3 stop:179 length:177 start_codon:yes stop_codon:yes gene_type:complete